MPGIVGVISKDHRDDRDVSLETMIDCMMHEPFYRSGSYINGGLGCRIGWICEQGTFSDCMPVWNEARDVCLLFSGEDFTDPAEIKLLRNRAPQVDRTNASYLAALYEEMGLRFLEHLNGWFSGVLVDLRQQSVF